MEKALPNADEVQFTGDLYPLSPTRAALARVCSLGFFSAVALGIFGANIPANLLPPEVLTFVQQKKPYVIGGGFLLNVVGNNIARSGAFEIYIDDKLVWSKLEKGQVPELRVLEKTILQETLLSGDDAEV